MPGADESKYPLRPCNHEEFDTRVMLHAEKTISHGYKRILIMANDTDTIVLGISFFSEFGADKLWVSFGIGKKLRNISNHDVCSTMSAAKTKALPALHVLKDQITHPSFLANPSSPSKCCLARVSGVGSNLKPAGDHSGLPSLEPPKP